MADIRLVSHVKEGCFCWELLGVMGEDVRRVFEYDLHVGDHLQPLCQQFLRPGEVDATASKVLH
jgi:hypothetical protein